MKAWILDPKCHFSRNGDIQFIHNYLFYTGALPFAVSVTHRTGMVHSVGAQGSIILGAHRKRLREDRGLEQQEATRTPYDGAVKSMTWLGTNFDLTDEEGYFINMDGTRSRMVHQYDRFGPNFLSWLDRQRGKLWEKEKQMM